MQKRLLAVDPSLTCSGWALFRIPPPGRGEGSLLAVGKIRSLSPAVPLPLRYLDLQQKVTKVYDSLQLAANDVLICESPTTMRDPRAAMKVEQVRGIFETVARGLNLSVPGRIHPRSVQQEIMGLRGKQLSRAIVKDTAVQIVKTVYGKSLEAIGFEADEANLSKNQDIVDAILIGALALTRIEGAQRGGVPPEEVFVAKVRSAGRRLPR